MDYCAFIGNFYNNGSSKIKVYSSQSESSVEIKDILNKFYNKNTVYIDIRDDYGNSYNHYFKVSDQVRLYMKTPSSNNEMIVNEMDYYNSRWPILQLRDYQVSSSGSSSKDGIQIAFPMQVGNPISNYILYSYNLKVGDNSFSTLQSDVKLNKVNDNGEIIFHYTYPVSFKNLMIDNGKFLSNYVLLKLSNNKNEFLYNQGDRLDNVFPLHMKDILGDDTLDDGDFRVYVYSSINAPIIRKNRKAYLANIGIAKDKYNVTFFAFNSLSIKESHNGSGLDNGYQQMFNLLPTGKFDYQMYLDEFQYTPGQSFGFLSALPYRCMNGANSEFMLQSFKFENKLSTPYNALAYIKSGEGSLTESFFADFDAFSITNSEYVDLFKKITPVGNDFSFEYYKDKYDEFLKFNDASISSTFNDAETNTTVFRYQPVYIDFTGTNLLPSANDQHDFTKKNTNRILCKSSTVPYYFLRVVGVPTELSAQNTVQDIRWGSIKVDMAYSTMDVVDRNNK
jgi:hypothetical protein